MLGPWRETGVITVPVEGPVSWTAREGAAEAAAVVLASNGAYEGPQTLTAVAAPTFTELAGIAADVVGRPVAVDVVGADAWLAAQLVAGQPEFVARFTLGLFQAARDGFFAGVDPLLGTLLGREPRIVRDALFGG